MRSRLSRQAPSRPNFDRLESRRLLTTRVGHHVASAHPTTQHLNESNLVYTTDAAGPERLDVHVPSGAAPVGGWPVVLAIHGGGWRSGDKSTYEATVDATLLAGGFAVVAPDYTLSRPGHSTWPENLNELREAVVWVRNNASKFAFNPNEVAAMGESAGAHLALLLGTDPAGVKTRINAVVDFYGPTDLASMQEDPNAAGAPAVTQLLGGTPSQIPATYTDASPVTHITPTTPPILIVQGTADQVVPFAQSVELAQALNANGVPNQFIPIEGAPHGFGLIVNGIDLGPSVVDFLRESLAG